MIENPCGNNIFFSKIETSSWKTMENYLYTLEICVSPNSLETLKVHMEITFLQELENILSRRKTSLFGLEICVSCSHQSRKTGRIVGGEAAEN